MKNIYNTPQNVTFSEKPHKKAAEKTKQLVQKRDMLDLQEILCFFAFSRKPIAKPQKNMV